MSLPGTLRFILGHPLAKRNRSAALGRFLKWQINIRLNPNPVLYPFVGGTKLLAWKGLTGVTGNIYTGLHEFEDMAFLLHFLRKDDFFADVGANVGSYTVLAAGVCASRTFSAEPLPATFKILAENTMINHLSERVTLRNIGIGAQAGMLPFTRSLDTMNHVASATETDSIQIPVLPLDEALAEVPQLIKIDVEGFEMAVLQGANHTLSNPGLKAIIIETNSSCERYGHSPADVHQLLLQHGFLAFSYEPFARKLSALNQPHTHNTIYLRDLDFVKNRLENAQKINLLGQDF